MKQRPSPLAGLSLVLLASLLLGGCAVTPVDHDPYYERYYEPVHVAPPPPYVEYIGSPPVAGHIWISGYWNWGGARYVWVPGYWQAPRPGHYWVPHRWDQNGGRWYRHGGHWAPGHEGGARPAPRPPPRGDHDGWRPGRDDPPGRDNRPGYGDRHPWQEGGPPRQKPPEPVRPKIPEPPRGGPGASGGRGDGQGDWHGNPGRPERQRLPITDGVQAPPRDSERPQPYRRSEEAPRRNDMLERIGVPQPERRGGGERGPVLR